MQVHSYVRDPRALHAAKGEHGEGAQGSSAAIKEIKGEKNQTSVFKTAPNAAQHTARYNERMEHEGFVLLNF